MAGDESFKASIAPEWEVEGISRLWRQPAGIDWRATEVKPLLGWRGIHSGHRIERSRVPAQGSLPGSPNG